MPSVTLYDFKPRFQSLLRPIVKWLASAGITANQVTIFAAVVSILLGGSLWVAATTGAMTLFLLLPLWFLLRMAFNAIDGILAREYGQMSTLGGFLNEISDPVSDAALILPFAALTNFRPQLVIAIVIAAILTELAGVTAQARGGARRYDGPMGKSDRALAFGALGASIGAELTLSPIVVDLLCVAIGALLVATIFNRVMRAVKAIDDAF